MNSFSGYLNAQGFVVCPSHLLLQTSPLPRKTFYLFPVYTCISASKGKSSWLKPCWAYSSIAKPMSILHTKYSMYFPGIQSETIYHYCQYNYSKVSLFRRVACTYKLFTGGKNSKYELIQYGSLKIQSHWLMSESMCSKPVMIVTELSFLSYGF